VAPAAKAIHDGAFRAIQKANGNDPLFPTWASLPMGTGLQSWDDGVWVWAFLRADAEERAQHTSAVQAWTQGAAQAQAAGAQHQITQAAIRASSSVTASGMSTGAKVAVGAGAVALVGIGGALAFRAAMGLPLWSWGRWH
jgi:hypothetical protein